MLPGIGRGQLRQYASAAVTPAPAENVPDTIRSRLRKNPQKTQRFITMSEAEEHVTERTRNVVILPPDTGDRDVPTDEEDFAGDEEDLHEPAGEIELEESSEDEEDE